MITNKFLCGVLGVVFLIGILLVFPVGSKAVGKPDILPDRYIVVLNENATNPEDVANEMAIAHGLSIDFVYTSALKGFAATIPQARLERIKADSRVQFVSEDRVVQAFAQPDRTVETFAQTIPTGISRINALANTNKGTGIGVAVIDTGIDLNHADLKANIVANYSCIKGKKTGMDDNGHGSHVAGTIAAPDNGIGVVGVASQAKLIAVKVLNSAGSGSWASIICGIDWVTANAINFNIKVANMSLGGSGSSDDNCGNTNNDAMHKAICRSKDAGVTYVVAAGNEAGNANSFVPAAYNDSVITVSALADSDGLAGGLGGATTYGPDDTFATFSNFGSVVDIGAPGVSIFSTWKGGSYKTISGTSMASPHVAGAAALYIWSNPSATWTQVRDGLVNAGEALFAGHTDPSGLHPERVLQAGSL